MPRAKKDLTEETKTNGKTKTTDLVPVCPVRGSVIYPAMVMPIDAARPISVRAIEAAFERDRQIIIVSQRHRDVDDPRDKDLYEIGIICTILRMRKNPDSTVQMMVQADNRVTIKKYKFGSFIEAEVEVLPNDAGDNQQVPALKRELQEKFDEIVRSGKFFAPDQVQLIQAIEDPGQMADHIAFNLDTKLENKQMVLETIEVSERLHKVLLLLDSELDLIETQKRIQQQVRDEIDKTQREYYLREQMKVIQRELRGSDEEEDEVELFRQKIENLGLSAEIKNEVERELGRLARMNADAAEANVVRTFLNWVIDLPWNIRSEDRLDLNQAAEILDQDHYGLEKVKDRVLEFLAVRQLRQAKVERGTLAASEINKGPILVFVGPPGVGKTSIARSIAKALGRKYVRIALGGARDEADIRGHRRTYIGALPGRIIQGLKTAGTKNPVFLLDEIDKLGVSYQGDPASALLEVLDPAQNANFADHYLEVPFDLSEVMFIATANYVEQIPAPLLDRMEFIEFTSYIEQEKLQIAKQYIVPRQIADNGLDDQVSLDDSALSGLINHYTREAGVRNLEREIGSLLRKAARRIAAGFDQSINIDTNNLESFLGPARYQVEHESGEDMAGLSTGMFYTPVGGDILFVETSVMPGQGLVLTGQLGDVMKESARAALSYAKRNAHRFHISNKHLDESEVHIHVPAGAVPKEGPSAGVTIATSLISALTGIPVRHDVSMTGEITLTGRVLAIGGLKEKVLGAKRAGIKHIILPKANEADLRDIPLHLRQEMEFHVADSIDEVLDVALVGGLAALETTHDHQVRHKKRSKRPALPA